MGENCTFWKRMYLLWMMNVFFMDENVIFMDDNYQIMSLSWMRIYLADLWMKIAAGQEH
jgi:hypothetical protein